MDDIQQEFNEFFKLHGGLLNYPKESDSDYINHILKIFRETVQYYNNSNHAYPIANVDIINATNLNAVVTKGHLAYHIGFNAGTLFLIKDIFCRMLATPDVLPTFGDPSKEEIQKIYNAQITDYGILRIAGDIAIPEDKTRYIVADYLATIALYFLLRHEYAHIIMGHVDYLSKTFGILAIEEKELEETESNRNLLSQTLELDADAFATNGALMDIFRLDEDIPESVSSEIKPYMDIKNNLFLHVFAFYTIFRLFGSKQYNKQKLLSYSHPPSGLRQNIILSTIATVFMERTNVLNINDVADICVKAVRSVEDAFTKISDQQFDMSAIEFGFSIEAMDHIRMLMKNWNNVRPLLEPFAVAKLVDLKK